MPESRLIENGDRRDFDWAGAAAFFVFTVATIVLGISLGSSPGVAIQLVFAIAATGLIAVVIWQACDPFADAAQWLGARFRIPGSVRGATLDAIASSMPELFSGIFFVVVALSDASPAERLSETTEGFASSIAICAGSSIYNLVLIPAICAIAIASSRPSRPQIEFEGEVLNRDGVWVISSQLGLLVILYLPRLHWWIALIAVAFYAIYIGQLAKATRTHRRATENDEADELPPGTSLCFGLFKLKFNARSVVITLAVTTLIAAIACYYLVEITNRSATAMGVPAFFVAVILAAAASSIPDTFMSLGAARRGDDSGAISNVFGSNIFDIFIGMSIPLLVCCYLNNWQPLELNGSERQTIQGVAGLRVLLFVLTGIVMFMLWRRRVITRTMGVFFCGLYLVFVGYAIFQAL